MDEFERRLGASLKAVRDEHIESFEHEIPRIRHKLLASRRRRQFISFGRLALAGAAAISLVFALSTPSVFGPTPATADEVKAAIRNSFRTIDTLSGTFLTVVTTPQPPHDRPDFVTRSRFVIASDGDFHAINRTIPPDGSIFRSEFSYDADRGAHESRDLVDTDLPPGPPDVGAPESLFHAQYRSYARTALSLEDASVDEVTYEGRDAWVVEADIEPERCRPIVPGCELGGKVARGTVADHVAITVDKRTGLPLRVVASGLGKTIEELTLQEFAVNEDVSAADLRVEPDPEAVRRVGAFRRVELQKVPEIAGYEPLVPTWTPPGFELTDVAVTKRGFASATLNRLNPESVGVVSLAYQRGLDRLFVTTRLTRGGSGSPATPDDWTDPFEFRVAPEQDLGWASQSLRLDSGPLAGVPLHLVVDPRVLPHVWGTTDELVVTVAGDLTSAELVEVAHRLR